jgi:hypothetical protein
MLFGETTDVYCENHKKSVNRLRGQNAEFLHVKAGGTYSDHYVKKLTPNNLDIIHLSPSLTISFSKTQLNVIPLPFPPSD